MPENLGTQVNRLRGTGDLLGRCPGDRHSGLGRSGQQQVPPLRYPGFPVEVDGVDELHAALFTEPHTRPCLALRDGKSGYAPVGMTILWEEQGLVSPLNYSAAKGAIVQLTKSTAIELTPHNIQVNAIAPGWIETDMTAPVRTTAINDEILARTPAGRWGQPQELAGTAVYLASAASDFVTGATIRVDGGYAIR
jgi:NAD(P)-dependent dehydrogenase (short-subunit alcohol dehydrogenase family)